MGIAETILGVCWKVCAHDIMHIAIRHCTHLLPCVPSKTLFWDRRIFFLCPEDQLRLDGRQIGAPLFVVFRRQYSVRLAGGGFSASRTLTINRKTGVGSNKFGRVSTECIHLLIVTYISSGGDAHWSCSIFLRHISRVQSPPSDAKDRKVIVNSCFTSFPFF